MQQYSGGTEGRSSTLRSAAKSRSTKQAILLLFFGLAKQAVGKSQCVLGIIWKDRVLTTSREEGTRTELTGDCSNATLRKAP